MRRNHKTGRVFLWLTVSALLFGSQVARAKDGPTLPRTAELFVLSDPSETARAKDLSRYIHEVIDPTGWTLVTPNKPNVAAQVLSLDEEEGAPAARAWLDLRDENTGALFFVDVKNRRAAIRRFRQTDGKDDLLLFEQSAQAFRTLLDALDGGEVIGLEVEKVRETLAPPPPPAAVVPAVAAVSAKSRTAETEAHSWQLDAGYGAVVLLPSVGPQHTAAAGVARWQRRASWSWAARVEFRHVFATTIAATPDVSADMSLLGLRVGLAAARRYDRWELQTGFDVGGDVVRLDVQTEPTSGYKPVSSGMRPNPVARLRARASHVWLGIALFIEMAAELELLDLRLAVRDAGNLVAPANPQTIRPALAAGFIF
ncbi:MAG: hypothetical protein SF187_05700 [Deltaproteobacteria bacterium]|nr:hypothetical protein [Deltaproteobacteria bacterium]